MGDFYTDNLATLLGKPKATIADYVEQNGILVPRRYSTLDDALSSGVPIIARSEHPQDYEGASNLLNSFQMPPKVASKPEELIVMLAKDKSEIDEYCELSGVSREQFMSQVSLSFWEKINGMNITVSADSAIDGRYHILVRGTGAYYIEADNGSVKFFAENKSRKYLALDVEKLIDFYEKVRGLYNFDPSHCYIMEVQIADGKIYFLQLHRGRDLRKSKFELERPPKQGEYEAALVRGCTIPEGRTFKTVIYHGEFKLKDIEGSAHPEMDLFFQEMMYRRTGLQIAFAHHMSTIASSVDYHGTMSKMFKPEISLLIDDAKFRELVSHSEVWDMVKAKIRTHQDQYAVFRVVADGRKAYISRVN